MNRPRFSRLRRRASRPTPLSPFFSAAPDSEPAWLELGPGELRLFRDGGDVAWSTSLSDPAHALAGREWAARDLATLDAAHEAEADGDGDEEVLLGRS